jgi:hypothetical protein
MKLWIIYKGGFVFSKVIAEMLQDHLENYIDVSVGKASKIEPSFIVEENLDYLIIGDIINGTIPSVEIQKWVLKFTEISQDNHLSLEALSGFLISLNGMNKDTLWIKFIQDNIVAERFYPPILHLKLDKTNLATETYVHDLVKEYSSTIIKFITNNKKSDK